MGQSNKPSFMNNPFMVVAMAIFVIAFILLIMAFTSEALIAASIVAGLTFAIVYFMAGVAIFKHLFSQEESDVFNSKIEDYEELPIYIRAILLTLFLPFIIAATIFSIVGCVVYLCVIGIFGWID